MSDLDAELKTAQRQAAAALRSWHLDEGRDVTEFEGFSLGGLSRMDAAVALARIFRQAAQGRDPEAADFFDDGQDQRYGPMPDFSLGWRREDARARAFRLAFKALRPRRPAPAKSVLLIGASSNRLLWDRWFAEKGRLPFRFDFALRYPPGLGNALRAARAGARLFDPAPEPLTRAQLGAVSAIRTQLEKLRSRPQWRALFRWKDRDLSGLFGDGVLAPFLGKLEELAVKSLAFEREFSAKTPDLVLIPNDSTPDMRLLLALAKRRRVPVWLLEHGFPIGGYVLEDVLICGNLDADLVLAWSGEDKRNYMEAGVPEERISVTGLPSFDRFLPAGTPRPLKSLEGATILLLSYVRLFGTTLYRDGSEERFFTETVRLLERAGVKKIIFKLHGGIARLDFYERLAQSLAPKCGLELLKSAPFPETLARADAVIGPVSTAIFETLLAGKEYYLMHLDPARIPPPLEPSNDFVAKDAEELERNLELRRGVPRSVLKDFCGIEEGQAPGRITDRLFAKFTEALSGA